jgi:hypothetical protein
MKTGIPNRLISTPSVHGPGRGILCDRSRREKNISLTIPFHSFCPTPTAILDRQGSGAPGKKEGRHVC